MPKKTKPAPGKKSAAAALARSLAVIKSAVARNESNQPPNTI